MRQLLPWIAGGLAWILVTLLVPGFLGMAPWLAKKLATRAARRLPPGYRERYEEEWAAEIEAMGERAGIGSLLFALLWSRQARQMAKIASQAPPIEPGAFIHTFPASFGEGILGTATVLFVKKGIEAVGVNQIVRDADAAPMTLYRRFGGKSQLVAAALALWSTRWLETLAEQVARYGDDPRARYAGLWEVLEQWFAGEGFHGSFIANAATELRGEPDHPAHAVIAAHRGAEREFLEKLATAVGAGDPPSCAVQLQLLVYGAIEAATIDRRPEAARNARALAVSML